MAATIPTADDIRAIVREEVRAALKAAGPEVLSTEQAAELAGVTAKTVRTWIEEGKLAAGHRGRLRAVRREDLMRFLAGEPGNSPAGRVMARIQGR